MRVYEFYFNLPKEKRETDFLVECFCFEPKNIYERKMGFLYIAGSLKNVLPKNLYFLEKLANFIKDGYYKRTASTPEKSLRKILKETNEYLEEILAKGDVSWLGNLSFLVLILKDFKFHFSKVGAIKIFLLRAGKIVDIERRLKLQDIEPYPLKIFGNIVTGKLIENDLILIFTEEIFNFFQEENLLTKIAKSPSILEDEIKKIFEEKKEKLKEKRGLLLAISLLKETLPAKKEIITSQISKEFSLKEIFKSHFRNIKEKISLLILEKKTFFQKIILNKRTILILVFLFLLGFGYLLTNFEQNRRMKAFLPQVKEIEENLEKIESSTLNEKQIQLLLKKDFEKTSAILRKSSFLPKDFSKRVLTLNEKILKKLHTLNKMEKILEPDIYFQFNVKEFIPQKLISFKEDLFFFSPYSKNILKLDKEKKATILKIDKKFNLACSLDDLILFFAKPEQLVILKDEKFFNLSLSLPYSESEFSDIVCLPKEIYFLEKKLGQVIRYSIFEFDKDYKLGEAEFLLEKAIPALSITFDKNLWALEKDSIFLFERGKLKEKIKPEIFPEPKEFTKIYTSPLIPYFFILEPSQKRILVFEKSGKILKQFQSEKFDNLLDFAISKDGKTIFLLNGQTLYQIKL